MTVPATEKIAALAAKVEARLPDQVLRVHSRAGLQIRAVVDDNGDVTAGTPFVTGAKVLGVVGELDKGKKIRVFKKKRTKQYRRTKGHRQTMIQVRIDSIEG